MESTYKTARKFTNFNIFKIDKETLDSEIYKESIIGENIKINGGTNYVSQNFDLRVLALPSTSFQLARDHYVQGYKLLKFTKNFSKIKRFFLIGHAHSSIKSNIFLSAYTSYETNDTKRQFEIDQNVYSALLNHETLKKNVEKFEINSYTTTIFVEEGGSIREKEEEFTESIEDNEFSFDVHISFLNHLCENKVKIVPIWVNLNNVTNSKDIVTELGNFLNSYYNKEENFFIFSSILTYFGRMYHYYGEPFNESIKEFKSKSFLRDPNNEARLLAYIKSIDEDGIESIKCNNSESLLKLSNFNYCREVYACLAVMLKNSNLFSETLAYQIKRFESIDEAFELNLVSFVALIFYNKL